MPFTAEIPKGMVQLAGRPILEYVLEVGSSLPLDGIVLIVNPDGSAIRNHFGSSFRGVPITYVVQEEANGLTRAVSLAEPHVSDKMLILLCDELYLDCSHADLVDFVTSRSADGVCGFVRTADEQRIRRNYAISTGANGMIDRLVEKPEVIWNDMQGTGTWFFDREFFDFVAQTKPHAVRGEPDFVAVIQEMVYAGRRVFGYDLHGSYLNINAEEQLEAARAILDSTAAVRE